MDTNSYSDHIRQSKGLSFPTNVEQIHNYYQNSENTLRFPDNQEEDSYRKPKKFFNENYHQYQDEFLDLQKPLPNHKATKTIFPDRTGTGELKLDTNELVFRERPTYEDNNVVIKLNNFLTKRGYRAYRIQPYKDKDSRDGTLSFPN